MLSSMDVRRGMRLALIRGQIALGGLALRAGLDLGLLEGPPLSLDAQPRAVFDELLEDGRDGYIDYRIEHPKHEFLSDLVHARGYLLHGSGSPQLEQITPTHATDHGARSIDATFATSDGIWPLFFATLDRERAGSIWNGCFHVRRGGLLRRYYFFFTEADPHDERIWQDGAIYVVPREPFVRTWIPNEWACPQPVLPLAKLAVSPADFPFRSRVLQLDRHRSLIGNLRRLAQLP